jgi:Domain of Unknown Function (DUF1206)
VSQTEQLGRRVRNSDALDVAARAGLITYGIVYLLIAWLALQLAFGNAHGDKASSKGAFEYLAQQSFGKLLLWAVVIGLALLVLWRLLEAVFGQDDQDGSSWGKRAVSAGKAVVYGALALSAARVATGSNSGKGAKGWTAKLLDLPAGPLIVIAVGAAIAVYGGTNIYRGWKEKFLEELSIGGKTGDAGRAYRMFGKVGYIAKGIALVLVGVLIAYAGANHDAKQSRGLDGALRQLLHQPFGQTLLIAIAVGLAAYGLFCFARARHFDRS